MGRGGAIAALLVLVRPTDSKICLWDRVTRRSEARARRCVTRPCVSLCLQAALAMPARTFVEPTSAVMARRRRVDTSSGRGRGPVLPPPSHRWPPLQRFW